MAHLVLTAALLLCISVAAEEVTPLEKVVTLLEELQTKVLQEGRAEAQTYSEFACFCKENQAEKSDAINMAKDKIDALEASMGTLTTERADADDDIADLSIVVTACNKALKEEHERRAKEVAERDVEMGDLIQGEKEVDNAMATLQGIPLPHPGKIAELLNGGYTAEQLEAMSASEMAALLRGEKKPEKTGPKSVKERAAEALGMIPGLTQLKARSKKLAAMAEALGLGARHAESSELVQTEPGAMQEEMMQTFIDLKKDYMEKRAEVARKDVKNKHAHQVTVQEKTLERADAEKGLAKANKLKSQKTDALATAQAAFTQVSAMLADDKKYISELAPMCNDKAAEYEQRQTMRATEITALTQAVSIMTKTADGAKKSLLAQRAAVVLPATEDAEDKADAEVEQEVDDLEPTSFVQLAAPRRQLRHVVKSAAAPRTGTDDRSKSALVASLLRERGQALKSQVLMRLAAQAESDPFSKIRVLVQELIERLLQEGADEASHQGWCDKELAKAKQSRQAKVDMIKNLNEALAGNEVRRDKADVTVQELSEEIGELEASLAKLTKEREAETAESTAEVNEANLAKDSILQAEKVLKEFYGTAAKAGVLLQQGSHVHAVSGAPGAGPDGAYTGAQSAMSGVFGMLEVIISDYDRTIRVAEQTEREAAKAYLEFATETKISINTKTMVKEATESELVKTNSDIVADKTSIVQEQALLDKAIQELQELVPICIKTGMSYEEKVEKREQEIGSLKEALQVLEDSTPAF